MSISTSQAPEKKEEKAGDVEQKEETEEIKPVEKELSPNQEIYQNLVLIARGVENMEPRFIIRVLRTLTTLRKKLNRKVLKSVLKTAFPPNSKEGQLLRAHPIYTGLPRVAQPTEGMDIDQAPAADSTNETTTDTSAEATDGTVSNKVAPSSTAKKTFSIPSDPATDDLYPECVLYVKLLLILANLDAGHTELAGDFARETVDLISTQNRRSQDQIAAKVYFYLARAYELQGRLGELQPLLLATRQTASLRKDETLEVTSINLLLRSYLSQKQYDQADKLIAKSAFQGQVNQAQSVRWLFYAGRLRAIQLNYSKAREYFQTAIRRAPKDEVAPGFVQIIHKYFIVVVLLTGVIPDRSLFRKPVLREALIPYFQIVQAVRVGDVTAFQKAFTTHEKTFHDDQTHFLILRLRHFVIKTALRTITLAYSRISLADVCLKLGLDSEEDTEYIVAKAIKDGVIDATIDHAGGWMQSRVSRDVYETDEPNRQFMRRVEHCTGLYNETVRAMRYPPNAHRTELDTAADARERDREIAQMIQDNDDDDLDEM